MMCKLFRVPQQYVLSLSSFSLTLYSPLLFLFLQLLLLFLLLLLLLLLPLLSTACSTYSSFLQLHKLTIHFTFMQFVFCHYFPPRTGKKRILYTVGVFIFLLRILQFSSSFCASSLSWHVCPLSRNGRIGPRVFQTRRILSRKTVSYNPNNISSHMCAIFLSHILILCAHLFCSCIFFFAFIFPAYIID
uniref:Uncharacterized protein n=1 Tax=Cacopsylla melanoneura TaxID=428564 RepID=A0A8D8QP70_9HEMI